MIEILIACFVVMFASLSALFLVSRKVEQFVKKHLHLLMAFAVGVFGVVAYFLLSESVEQGSLFLTSISVAIGLLVMTILPRLVPEFHHHHTDDTEPKHSRGSATRILASDGVHNSADGILITASFLSGGTIGVGVFLSVFIHEVVQGITEFFVLKQAGYSNAKAITRNFLVQSTILVGAIGSYFFLEAFQGLEPVLLGLAAGGFFAVLLQDLIPSSLRSVKSSKSVLTHVFALSLGVFLMLGISLIGEHPHSASSITTYDGIKAGENIEL